MSAPKTDEPVVLVVDDEKLVRTVVSRSLVGHGFRVLEASDGKEALATAFAQLPDLVVLDLCMPSLDGGSVCRALRRDERTRELPILVLTGLIETHTEVEVLELGADDYMTKPFDPAELRARLKALRRRNAESPAPPPDKNA
ncbi:MAG: response regulator [Elusimicrobiota bacterium]|jgi:DNA-binding response OmpR family regulator